MKRLIYVMVVLVLCCRMALPALAEAPVTITVQSTQQCQGGNMSLEVSIQNNPGYGNISLAVEYDSAALQLTEIEKVNAPSMFLANPETGKLSAAGMNDIHGDGIMFILHFTVLKAGEHTVSVRVDSLGKADGTLLTPEVVAGHVQVGQHSYETTQRQPTCTVDGATVHTCGICGDRYETDVIPAAGHQLDGPKDETCSVCGQDISQPPAGTQGDHQQPDDPQKQSNGRNILLVVASVLFGILLTVLIGMLLVLHRRNKARDIPLPVLDEEYEYFDEEDEAEEA